MSAQQAAALPRDIPSGSQTAMPPHVLPQLPFSHNGHGDLRTAPLPNGDRMFRRAAFPPSSSRIGGRSPSPIPGRREFLAPFNALYDTMQSAEGLRHHLQDLLTRYEAAYTGQVNAMGEFKNTATQATGLLQSLQAR